MPFSAKSERRDKKPAPFIFKLLKFRSYLEMDLGLKNYFWRTSVVEMYQRKSFQTGRMSLVTLNVGGTPFSTNRSTLTSEPLSLLAKMVGAQSRSPPSPCLECCAGDMMQNTMSDDCPHRAASDEGTVIQVDCDPAAFSVILNCLRHGVIVIPPYLPVELIKAAASSLGLTQVESKLDEFERKGTSKKEWLKLNVGGQIFETTRATLTSHPSR